MTGKTMVLLRPVGDVELWYAEPEDCSWRLPLHIEWKENQATGGLYGLVVPGVCFYHAQMLAVESILGPSSMEAGLRRWLLYRPLVHSLLRKAPGIHAEAYYHWPGGVHPPIRSPYHAVTLRELEKPPPRRAEQFRSLAEFVSRERGLPSDVVLTVLTALSQVGARWLLERQVMDLGFVRLAALPFRINWKEIISFKCKPWNLLGIFRLKDKERDKMLDRLGLQAIACSVHNVGLRLGNPRRVEYTIEALPTKSFEAAADKAEEERIKTGRTAYVAFYEEAVELFYSFIVEALGNYVRKVVVPWGAVSQFGKSGLLGFLPVSRWRAKVRGVFLCDLPAHIVPPVSDFSVLAEQKGASDPLLVSSQAAELQKVSALPSSIVDVREREKPGDLDEPRPEGTDGLSLPHASEGDGSGS